MKTICVDDNRDSVELVCAAMKEIDPAGEHTGFINPAEALLFMGRNPVDVCFTDIMMPGINGLEFAKKVKETQPRCNIIFVTAYSDYAVNAFSLSASGYLLKPLNRQDLENALDNLRYPIKLHNTHRIQARCFGTFEVFCEGQPLKFKRSLTREFFAYLIDQRGRLVPNGEIISILWEDSPGTENKKSQIRHLFKDLKDTLHSVGAEDVLVRSTGVYAVKEELIDCDYYEYMKGNPAAVNLYTGEYMTQYSWSEFRLF